MPLPMNNQNNPFANELCSRRAEPRAAPPPVGIEGDIDALLGLMESTNKDTQTSLEDAHKMQGAQVSGARLSAQREVVANEKAKEAEQKAEKAAHMGKNFLKKLESLGNNCIGKAKAAATSAQAEVQELNSEMHSIQAKCKQLQMMAAQVGSRVQQSGQDINKVNNIASEAVKDIDQANLTVGGPQSEQD